MRGHVKVMGVAQPSAMQPDGWKTMRGTALMARGCNIQKSRLRGFARLNFGGVFYELPPSRGTTMPKTADKKETGPHRFAHHQLQMLEKGNRV